MKSKKITQDQELKIHLMKWCIDKCSPIENYSVGNFENRQKILNLVAIKLDALNLYNFILRETSK